jgi:CheY-like chemotaxis protein
MRRALSMLGAVIGLIPAGFFPQHEPEKIASELRVLVAEDHPINREVIRSYLRWVKLDCDFAVNGREAVDMLGRHRYDLLLLDMQMPVMSGLDALPIIRGDKRNHNLYIVALTAYALKEDRERFLKAGCDDYLPKPIDKERFREIIDYVRMRKQHSEVGS